MKVSSCSSTARAQLEIALSISAIFRVCRAIVSDGVSPPDGALDTMDKAAVFMLRPPMSLFSYPVSLPPRLAHPMEVLLVEDEARLGKTIQRGLAEAGHECAWARDGEKALQLALTQQFDVVVLDLLLPDRHGLEVLESVRREGIQTPMLILTALGSVDDRVRGLDKGADDYLVKPFAFPELLARLQALSRRSVTRPAPCHRVGPLELDLSTRKVRRDADEIDLSPTEFSILELLMRHAGNVVTRKMLNEHVWGEDWGGMTNVIDVHINRLRRKVDRDYDVPLIHTIRGRGYALRKP